MSMPRAVRHINEIRVLETVFRHRRISRAGIARQLGLTRSTASSIVATLADEGLLVEDISEEDKGSRTGRPGTFVRLHATHGLFIGADIGVGRTTVIALDMEAEIVAEEHKSFELDQATPEIVTQQLVLSINKIIDRLRAYQLRGVCVTVPGIVDHAGQVLFAPILGWRQVPVLKMLHDMRPDLPLLIAENDANAFAMAELYQAGNSAPDAALYIFLDAGVGGAIVNGGAILRGHNGYAGEFGHIIVGDEGFVEVATLRGSLESFIGRDAVMARHRFHGGSAKNLEDFFAAAKNSERAALATLADWSSYMGRGLASLTSIFNPQKIVLGGPVAVLYPLCENAIMESLKHNLLADQPLPDISLSSLGLNGPAKGAASILHKRMLSVDQDLVFHGSR